MRKVLPKVKKIINRSFEEAKLYNDYEIKIEYIITALINDYNNDGISFLIGLGIDIDDFHKKLEKRIITKTNKNKKTSIKNITMNNYTEKIIKESETECDKLGENYLNTTHIILSVLKEKNNITNILKNMGVSYTKYKNSIQKKYLVGHHIKEINHHQLHRY